MSVVATGTDITYQWRRNDVNLINNSNVSGVTSPNLTFASVTSSDTASNYNVVVYGDCAPVVSANASLSLILYTNTTSLQKNGVMTISLTSLNRQTVLTLNNNDQIGNSQLTIYNTKGQLLMSKFLSNKVTYLSKNKFVKGIYFYKLIQNNTILQSGKFVTSH